MSKYRDELEALRARNAQLEQDLADAKDDGAALRANIEAQRNATSKDAATVRVSRVSSYADRLRAYEVFIDGQPVGPLRAGEDLEVKVQPGPHHMIVKIDWCSSKPIQFTLTSGDTGQFECASNLEGWRAGLALFYVLFRRDHYLTLKQVF